jgi:hypothetical protein
MPKSVVLNIMKYAGEVKDKGKLHKRFVFCKHLQGIKCYSDRNRSYLNCMD